MRERERGRGVGGRETRESFIKQYLWYLSLILVNFALKQMLLIIIDSNEQLNT